MRALNNKGIAISSILYTLLVLFVALIFGILGLIASSKATYDTLKIRLNNRLNGLVESNNTTSVLNFTESLLYHSETYNYMGGTYLKGLQDNNYLWYSGNLYRIMGKDEYNNIRLISEGNITSIPYHSSSSPFSTSYLKAWLNSYFYNHLSNTSILQNTSYCTDPISDISNAKTICTSSVIDTKVTTLSLDEYVLSSLNNSNSDPFWTLSTYTSDTSRAWYINESGDMDYRSVSLSNGVRPVITISSKTIITDGDGTLSFPIMVDDSTTKTGKLIDNAVSGDYVILAGNKYRVIEKIAGTGTKLILDNYLSSTETYTNMITKMSNNTYLTQLGLTTSDSRLVNYTWDRGNNFTNGKSYTVSLATSTNIFTSYIGGIRVGEMYSSNSNSIPLSSRKNYWTLTPYSSSNSWNVYAKSFVNYLSNSSTSSVRPALMISLNVNITKGNGTLENPYEI